MNDILRDRVDALTKAGAKAALQQLRLALQQSQKKNDTDSMAWALLHTAMVLRGQRKLSSLLKILTEALGLFSDNKDTFGEACTLYEMSIANRELGRNTLAFDYGSKAAYLFQSLNRMQELGWSYHNLATILLNQSRRAEGLSYAKKAHGIFIEYKSDTGLAWNSCVLGLIHSQMGFLSHARSHYDEALALFEKGNSKQGRAWALLGIGMVLRAACNIDEAETTLTKAKAIFSELEIHDRVGWCLLNLAALKRMKGQQDESIRFNKEAIQLFTPLRNRDGVAWGLFQIAQIHRDHGHLVKAWQTFREALQLHADINSRTGQGWGENEIGETYLEMGDLAHAQESFIRARVIAEQLDLLPLKADVERNMASLYLEEGLIQKASEALNMAEAFAQKCEARSMVVKILLVRTRMWLLMGDAARAKESGEAAAALIESSGLEYVRPVIGLLRAETLIMEGKSDDALAVFMDTALLSKKMQQRRHRAEALLGAIQLQRHEKGAAALALSLFYVEKDVRAVGARKLKSKFLAIKGVLAAQANGTLDNRYFHQGVRAFAALGLNSARKQLLDLGIAFFRKEKNDRSIEEAARSLRQLLEKGPVDLHLVRPRTEWNDLLPVSVAV